MDDITKTQQSFARKALIQPEHRFADVYHLICREEWIRLALSQVLANTGSRTAGVDGVTKRQFKDDAYSTRFIAGLQTALKTNTYCPEPVKRHYINKANGRKRPLGIPTIRDRVVQMLLKLLLEPIWESDFLDCSSGFRPNRRAMDCIAMCYRLMSGKQTYYWIVEGDISGCFDHVQHDILLDLISRRIQDRRVLSLIESFLKAGVMEGQLFQHSDEGAPQGGICSPLFANRYLHELDRYWWENYGNLTKRQKEQRRRNNVGNCRLLRYADDFVLLTNGPREEAYRLRSEFQAFLHERLKLELSAEKTRVTHINDGFDFLGFNIRRYNNREERNKHVLLVKPSEKSVDRLKAKIRQMTAKTHAPDNPYLKMLAVNLVLRGWGNYYQHVNAKAVLQGLDYWINDRMLRWFANHHEYGIRNALTDYQHREGERKNLAVKTPKGQLLFLYLMRDKPLTRYVDEKRTNPYLAPWQTALLAAPEQEDLDLEHTWNGAEYAPGWQAARTARLELDEGRCVRCGTTENVDVHHLKQRRWRRRRQGNDDISNLRTLCKDCHTAVHQGVIAVAGTGAPDALKGARPVRREA